MQQNGSEAQTQLAISELLHPGCTPWSMQQSPLTGAAGGGVGTTHFPVLLLHAAGALQLPQVNISQLFQNDPQVRFNDAHVDRGLQPGGGTGGGGGGTGVG